MDERLINWSKDKCDWCSFVTDILQVDEFGNYFCSDHCQEKHEAFLKMVKQKAERGYEL